MNNFKWEKIPFQNISGSLCENKVDTQLPFCIGAVTRHGKAHSQNGINNQDAVHLVIENDFIVGVLSDGATNNHELIVNEYSFNEVGASLIAHIVANLCAKNVRPRKNKMNQKKFLRWLSEQTILNLKKIEKSLQSQKDELISTRHNLFTASVIGFIIRKKEFLVFHCGDGFVSLNNKIQELNSDYLSRYFNSSDVAFQEIFHGNTKDLDSLSLFTDGFNRRIIESDGLNGILKSEPIRGYWDLVPEFHEQVIESLDDHTIENWPYDDATTIILKKAPCYE